MSKLISKIVVPDSNEATGYSLYNVKDSGAIHSSDVGVAGGVASLDNSGKVPSSLLPSYVDDVVEGYYHENKFYTTYTPGQEEEDPGIYSGEITAETGKIYVDIPTNQSYRWSGSAYIVISSPYVLPTASANTLGGVKVGNNLSIDQNGVLSAQASSGAKTNEENGIGIGTCSTSSSTALAVTLSGYNLVQNGIVAVTFANDVPAGATLNVNGKGAKSIYYKGAAIEADTIKADDTVMFAYDGTNYVVTSLGGGGSVVFPEFVTIQLTQTGGDDSALIGATVVVTNDDTSATILSTTWDGSDIHVQVNAGVNYTVTVGYVSSLDIIQNTQSYIAESGLSRTIEFSYLDIVIDMGLPSGTKWARKNIDVSRPNGFAVSEFQYECSYFSWGNIVGHSPISGSAFSYNFGSNNSGPYAQTPGSQLSGNVPVSPTYDIARAVCGEPWRLPTVTEFQELINNCDFVQADGETVVSGDNKLVTVNSIVGIYLKSKINGNHLFLPCCGQGYDKTWSQYASDGYYWSGSLSSDATKGLLLKFTSGGIVPQYSVIRCYGFTGRPVM